jgi:hypothetical protein
MSDETRMILEMLREGKITVEQAERLLGAVGSPAGAAEGAGDREPESGETSWSWNHSCSWGDPGSDECHASWTWVGDLGAQIQTEVHRATSEARTAVAHAMAEARRAGEEARRAGREAREQVIRIVQQIGRDPE